mgnify:CR=1 FL=1
MSIFMRRAFFGFPHFILLWRCFTISTKENLINEEIKIPEVRLVTDEGEMLGVVKIAKALEMAQERDLDLVLISPAAVPPVCKIMDYGKFKFEESKREKENRKNQKVVDTKEVRLSPSIDFETKLRNAIKFLKGGDKVKVSVRFRGREVHHSAVGEELLLKFAEGCAEVGVVDKKPKLEGRNMAMFLSPKK